MDTNGWEWLFKDHCYSCESATSSAGDVTVNLIKLQPSNFSKKKKKSY